MATNTHVAKVPQGEVKKVEGREQGPQMHTIAPPVDIYENERELLVIADLPGIAKDQVHIHLEPERLSLEAQRTFGEETYQYKRVFTLSPVFDTDKVQAKMDKGVLTLTLPKSPKVIPRQIPVTST